MSLVAAMGKITVPDAARFIAMEVGIPYTGLEAWGGGMNTEALEKARKKREQMRRDGIEIERLDPIDRAHERCVDQLEDEG